MKRIDLFVIAAWLFIVISVIFWTTLIVGLLSGCGIRKVIKNVSEIHKDSSSVVSTQTKFETKTNVHTLTITDEGLSFEIDSNRMRGYADSSKTIRDKIISLLPYARHIVYHDSSRIVDSSKIISKQSVNEVSKTNVRKSEVRKGKEVTADKSITGLLGKYWPFLIAVAAVGTWTVVRVVRNK